MARRRVHARKDHIWRHDTIHHMQRRKRKVQTKAERMAAFAALMAKINAEDTSDAV